MLSKFLNDTSQVNVINYTVNVWIPCEQWFLQAGRYFTKGEKWLWATVCFSIRHAHPRDAYMKCQITPLSLDSHETFRDFRIQQHDSNKKIMSKTMGSIVALSHFFIYISLLFLCDCEAKMPNFSFNGERKRATTKFYFSFWNWIWSVGIQL